MSRTRWAMSLAAAVLLGPMMPATWAEDMAPQRFDGQAVVRLLVKDRAELDRLESLGVIILNCSYGPGKLDVVASPAQLAAIGRLGIPAEILEPDLQRAIEAQRPPVPVVAGADLYADFFLDYRQYDGEGGIVWFMNELVSRYPALASMVDVGTTLQGRTIWGLRVTTSASTAPGVVYFGCEHAREWITSTVPTHFAQHLLENYGSDSTVTDLMDNVEFYLIPVFNVDGYIYTWTNNRMWRKNRRDNGNGSFGVDINRNWGEGFGGIGSSGVPSNDTYRGPSAFSEPETAALRDFLIARPNIRAQLDIHSYSQLILWPHGYTSMLPADQDYYRALGSAMQSMIEMPYGTVFDIGPVYTAIYPASGVSVDWTYAQLGLLSVSFECRDTGQFHFLLPADQIVPSNEELGPALLSMANSDWVRQPARFEFPDGLPRTITPGVETDILVRIIEQTDAVVPGTPAIHYRFDTADSFNTLSLAALGGGLYEAALPATNCSSTPEFYFSAATSGGIMVRNPPDTGSGASHSALMQSDRVAFMTNDLSTTPGWSVEGQWAWGQPTGSGGQSGPADPTSGYTGPNVYGYNLTGDYPNFLAEQRLTTSAFDCTGQQDVRLEFRRWLGVESPRWDRAKIEVSNNAADWTRVWRNSEEVGDATWQPQSLDISAVADDRPEVYIRWTMGPTDSAFQYCGWNIDDVVLSAGECNGLVGDWEGDGDVDSADYARFEPCFGGSGTPPGPGCRVFDSDSDNDVDCDDWVEFHTAWTGPGEKPAMFEACADRIGPVVAGAGARYLSIVPPGGTEPVAMRLVSPAHPCLDRFVDHDSGNAAIARLVDAPVYRLPADWGVLLLTGSEIAANTVYEVRTVSESGVASQFSDSQTLLWGDAAEPTGTVDVLDIAGAVDCLKGLAESPPRARCDMEPDAPSYTLNVLDVASVVDAVKGFVYPFGAPCP